MPPFKKVIIWGFPLYSHTHSFVHYGWYKAFCFLGYETYWFDDNNFPDPSNFDYSNCLFISEGYADKNIPIRSNSVYYIHICINPEKYLQAGARLIDLRHNVQFLNDFSYDYTLDKNIVEKIDEVCFYEKNASDIALKQKFRKNISGYEAIYISWATDLLPHEINFNDINIPKIKNIYNIGSVWSANQKEILEFYDEASKHGIGVIFKDPWKEKTTCEENKKLVQISYMAPDIRGSGPISDDAILEKSAHLFTGYIPCRTFKNISYGQLGATNSWSVSELFNGMLVYNNDVRKLFHETEAKINDKNLILEQMNFVKLNHTYMNRIACILSIL